MQILTRLHQLLDMPPPDAPDLGCSAQVAGTAECSDVDQARRRWRWPLAV